MGKFPHYQAPPTLEHVHKIMSMAFVHVYVCVAAAATFSGKNTRACMQFRSTQALHCWLVACTALIVPAVESCPSFTSSVEEGRAVCPGEELTYTCTIFQIGGTPIAVWSGFCGDSSYINIIHGLPAQESGMCGPFTVQATASDGDCYTSTLTVTASPELNGTVFQCSHESVEVGRATLLMAGIHVYFHVLSHSVSLSPCAQVLPPPSPSPPKTPPLTLSPALPLSGVSLVIVELTSPATPSPTPVRVVRMWRVWMGVLRQLY